MDNKKQIERLETEREELLKRLVVINEQLRWLKPMPKSEGWHHKRKPEDSSPRFVGVL